MILEIRNQKELARAFRLGEVSPSDYIAKMKSSFERREPTVLAFLPEEGRFERLSRQANELVFQFPDPQNRPPLFGMPVGIKDIFHADGFATQAGSRLPSEELQGDEAESVTRLKKAGALILGKTVTTEFAYFTPGPTRNPHNPEHTPGGSSSGSAASVGADLCPLAIGTQTIGSVIRPAAFCGVVGLKPTYERISRAGVIPLSPSLDHIGFFTPDVSTAKVASHSLYKTWGSCYTHFDRLPVLGVPTGPYLDFVSDYAMACFDTFCNLLLESGYKLQQIPIMGDFKEIRNRHEVIMSFEAAQVHAGWFEKYRELYSPKFIELIKRGRKITEDELRNALNARDEFRDQIIQIMNKYNIDVWICPPTTGPAPKGLDSTGDPVMNLPWTQIGFPAVLLPTSKTEEGLPMGVQIIGKWGADEELLAWSEEIEKVASPK